MTTQTLLLIAVITGGVASLVASSLMLLLSRQSAKDRYNDERHRAELETVRKSLEERIYALNGQLTATLSRWQDTNHLVISGQKADSFVDVNTKSVPRLDFLRHAGVDSEDYAIDRRLIFVLMPFHPDFEPLYKAIQSACQEFGLVCLRGDEEHVHRDLLTHILKLIVKARLVIAVVEGRNPNVFYELGIAHSLGKPVLTIAKASEPLEHLPIDIRNNRMLFYTNTTDVKDRLIFELTKALISE